MKQGSKSHELEADVPASELWKIYGTLRFVELVHQLLPQVLHKVDVVTGNGAVGTVIHVTFPPGSPGPQSYKEEFVKIDNENRVKEAAVTEGDILAIGFTKYVTRFEIIEKGSSSSVIRSTVEYEFDDGRSELEAVASTAPVAAAAETIAKYVKEQSRAAATVKGSKCHELETDVPASALWKIYGTLRFVELVHELLPQVLHKVDVVTGNGAVGTVIHVTFPPGNPGPQSYKEEFVKIDNENRVKEAAVTEGDILAIGFTKYVTRFEIIEKGPSSSVIRSTVDYEFDDGRSELEAVASTAPVAAAAETIAKYVKEQMAAA